MFGLAGAALLAGAVFGLVYALGGSSTPLIATRNSLAVIEPGRNRLVEVVPVGNTPRGVAAGRDFVWVANSADGTLTQIDQETFKDVKDPAKEKK